MLSQLLSTLVITAALPLLSEIIAVVLWFLNTFASAVPTARNSPVGSPNSCHLFIRSQIKCHLERSSLIILFQTLFYFNFFKLINLFLFSYNCLHFLPFPPPHPASPTSLPHLYPPSWFCLCVLYSSSYRPLSPLSTPHSPVAIVTMFLISMSLAIFCLLFSFVDYVPVKGEIIESWSLTAWLISLSIMHSVRVGGDIPLAT